MLLVVELDPGTTASKEMGPQSYNHMALNSTNNLNEHGRLTSLEPHLTDTLILALRDLKQKPPESTTLSTYRTLRLCCSKLLSLL